MSAYYNENDPKAALSSPHRKPIMIEKE